MAFRARKVSLAFEKRVPWNLFSEKEFKNIVSVVDARAGVLSL